MSIDKTTITIRIEDNLLEKIREIATKEKRSMNQQFEYATEFFINEYERINGLKK